MGRRTVLVALLVGVLLSLPSTAGAATVAQIATYLDKHQAYVERSKPPAKQADLEAALRDYPAFRAVFLAKLPAKTRNNLDAARQIQAALAKDGKKYTVVVVSNGAIRGFTNEIANTRLEALLKRVRPRLKATAKAPAVTVTMAGLAKNVDAVASGKTARKGSSGGFPWLWLAIVVGAAALIGLVALRLREKSRDTRRRRRSGSIWTARQFQTDRLDSLSRRHAALIGPVAEHGDEDPELNELSEQASGKLLALRRSLPQLASPRELRTCAGELDQIEWLIQVIESRVAGVPAPSRPLPERPALCFFTHEHGLAQIDIDLRKPDGTVVTVRVCPANARALENGEPPAVSQVHYAGREIPWPAAPTWYGAPGWSEEDLPGLEYKGREIWGRDLPKRVLPVDGPAGVDVDVDEGLPPGVDDPGPVAPAAAPFDLRPAGSAIDEPTRALADEDMDVPEWALPDEPLPIGPAAEAAAAEAAAAEAAAAEEPGAPADAAADDAAAPHDAAADDAAAGDDDAGDDAAPEAAAPTAPAASAEVEPEPAPSPDPDAAAPDAEAADPAPDDAFEELADADIRTGRAGSDLPADATAIWDPFDEAEADPDGAPRREQ